MLNSISVPLIAINHTKRVRLITITNVNLVEALIYIFSPNDNTFLEFFAFICFFFPCRRSVIETSRSLKELFHEARERASKALGFAKMLRKVSSPVDPLSPVFKLWYVTVTASFNILLYSIQDLEIAAEFSLTSGVPSLLQALKAKNYVKVITCFSILMIGCC